MARLLWALTCQRVITDQETNNVSYIDAVEQITVPGLPAIFGAQLCVSSLWKRERDNERLVVRHRLVSPSGSQVSGFRTEPIEMSKPRHRLNLVLAGFRIEEEGEFQFEIDVDVAGHWKRACALPISVEVAVPPAVGND